MHENILSILYFSTLFLQLERGGVFIAPRYDVIRACRERASTICRFIVARTGTVTRCTHMLAHASGRISSQRARTQWDQSVSKSVTFDTVLWDLPWACPTVSNIQSVWDTYEYHLLTNIASASPKFDSIV